MSNNDAKKKFYQNLLQDSYNMLGANFSHKRGLLALAAALDWITEQKYDFSLADLQKGIGVHRVLGERIWTVLIALKVLSPTRTVNRIQLVQRTKSYGNLKIGALADALRYRLAERGYTDSTPEMKSLLKFSKHEEFFN